MAQNIFRLVLTDEAQNFIESLPEAVSYKIYYNIKRVAGGERNKELFKKLENSEIWDYHFGLFRPQNADIQYAEVLFF